MSIKEEFEKIIEQRIMEDKKCLPELPDYWETSPVIKAEIELFSRSLQETIAFLDNDCTGEQLAWLMEVADEVSEKLQSWDFIDALYHAAERNPQDAKKHNVLQNIEFAIGQLNDEVYYQRYPKDKDGKENQTL